MSLLQLPKVVQEAVNEVMTEMASASPERRSELKAKMRIILGDERYCQVMGIPPEALNAVKPAANLDSSKTAPPALETGAKSKKIKDKAHHSDDGDMAELQAKLQV